MTKTKENWLKYVAEVPGLDASVSGVAANHLTDNKNEYLDFLGQLPVDLNADSSQVEDSFSINVDHNWCLCEMPEGEFPRVYVYQSLDRVIEAILKREGKETAVWVTYGVPLRITKPEKQGPNKSRYLLLPNNLAVEVAAGEPNVISQLDLPDGLEVQEEGWLGDQGYLECQNYYFSAQIPNDAFSADDSQDEDDEDSGMNSV